MNQLLAMRIFTRVVDAGSFSQAANQLNLPRSTASKFVTDLEKHLGVKLLHRTTRTVALTTEGSEYYRHAARLIAELDEVEGALSGRKLKPTGHLRIDVPSAFAAMLAPALPAFHREYPGISIALGVSDRTLNIVGEGVDCAIRAGTLPDMAMVGRRLADAGYVTCAAPAYLARMGVPQTPQALQDRHVCVGYFFAASGKSEPFILARGSERYEINACQFSANDGAGQVALIAAGLGVGQPLRRFVQARLDAGELVEVLADWARPPVPFHAVYPPNRHQSARLKVFVDWLIATFGPAGAGGL